MSKYIKNNRNSKVTIIFSVILLVIVVAWVWLETAQARERDTIKPDGEFPMVNANVSWEQTWHKGAWNE